MQEEGDSSGFGGVKGHRVPTLPVLTVTKEQESLKKIQIFIFFSFGFDTLHPQRGQVGAQHQPDPRGQSSVRPPARGGTCNGGGSLMQREPSHRAGGWQGHHPSLSLPCTGRGAGWHDLAKPKLLPGLENDRMRRKKGFRGEKGGFWVKRGFKVN